MWKLLIKNFLHPSLWYTQLKCFYFPSFSIFYLHFFLRAKAEMVRRTALANSQIRCRREGGAFGFHSLYVCFFPYFVFFFFFSLFFSSSIFFTNKRPKMAGRKKLPSLAYFRHTTNFNPFNDRALRKGREGLTKKKIIIRKQSILVHSIQDLSDSLAK